MVDVYWSLIDGGFRHGDQRSPTNYHQLMVDHLVSYVLYHTDKVSPDIRDMISKRFT